MKANFRFLCLFLVCIGFGMAARAQLTGIKTIPSTNYPTLKVAIDSLNQYGVGTGGVTIQFSPATTETAPVGGYQLGSATLNASTSSGKTITINGNGTVINAFVGTSTSADGIFYIMGTDWVTINGLNLAESAANTTTTTQMEWGYSLVKLSGTAPFDGCQNVTITNCTINLNKTYTNTIGIRAAHTIAGSSSILTTTGATAASTNSYNKFTSNVINNTTRGIQLIGISSGAAAYDKANVIGGTSASLGNTITVGGSTNTSYGTYTQYDSVITISNNNFFVNTTQGNTAVYHAYMSTGVGDLTVTNNLFDVNVNMTSASMYCYYNSSSHTDAGNNLNAVTTHTISNNTITGNNPVATSSYLYGLYESSAYSKNLYINNNQIRDINWNVSTGYLYLVYQYLTYSPKVEVNNNLVYNIQQRQPSSSGYIYGFYLYNYATPTGTLSMQNNIVRKIKSNYFLYAYYNYASYTTPPAGYAGQIVTAKNNVTDSVDLSTAGTGYCYNYWCYNGFDSTECSYNKTTNITGSATGTTYVYNYSYGYYGPSKYIVKGNLVNNITGFNLYNYNYLGYYATLADSNVISNITWTGTSGSMTNMLGYYGSKYVSSNNRVNNITAGGGQVYNYMGMYGSDALVKYNAITNITLNGAAYIYNYIGYNPSNCEIHHVRVDSITQGTSTTFYPWYSYATGFLNIHDCILSNLTTAATGIALYPYYLNSASATTPTTFYNNFLTNINVPAAYANTASCGILLNSNSPYTLYNNTIRISPGVAGGAGYGFTGIYYQTGTILDLRNNIINVNVTPTTGGFTTALRRAGGTAGVSPTLFLGTSNGNIYYAPNVANSYLYAEGTSATSVINTYSLANDPAFNTPCGLFKSFLGHDQASFTENNLTPGAIAATYVPAGTSYAEKGAVPTSNPTVTTDFANVTRGAVADIGALEFNGSPLDNAPPIISYNPIPVNSYCSTPPTLVATITDNSGVNNTMSTPSTPGNAPRLYYRKTTEGNAFGANASSFSGWKWVEPKTISGSSYTFDFDYSLLTSSVGPGDTITYFVIAQDLASPVNAGASVVSFPVCPGSVQLGSTNAPTKASPTPNQFVILNTPTFLAKAFPGSSCGPGSTVYNIAPTPVGAGVQWQSATLTGSFSNISGATSPTYTTPTNTATMRYRALILCGTSTLATTALDTFVIAAPAILSTVGDTVCGYDTMFLSANVTPFTTAKWYTTATGGTSFYSGNNYKQNPRTSSVTYYVSANTPNASTEMVSKTPPVAYTYGVVDGAGLEMRFRNPATNFYSTTVYPYSANGSFNVELRDSLDNPIPGYNAGPFTVSGGAGTTPVVLNLNWKNIPAGRYFLCMTNIVNTPYLNMEYNSLVYPYNSPSGNVSILNGRYSTSSYYAYFYYNIIGADCESTSPRVPVTGTVTPAPAITVSSPNVPGICLGNSATLNVASPNTSYTFTWTTRPGATTLTGATQTVSPTVSTTYDMIAFDPYTGCKNYDSVRINVNPVPAPPTIAPTNPTTCGGKPVQLIASAPPGSAGVQQVGTGTATMSLPGPFYGTYTGNRSQYLIKSAELFAAGIKIGQITSLAFQSSATGYTLNNFEIRLANAPSPLSAIPSTITCWAGMTLVYQQATLIPPSTGWNTFTFNQPTQFMWNGGDLIVDVSNMNCPNCPSTPCSSWGSSASVLGTTMSYQSSYQVYNDNNCGVIACPTSGAVNTSSSTTRPNMRIGYREPQTVNWLNVSSLYKTNTPSGPVSLTDTNSIVYAAPTTTTVYTAVTNASGCLSVPSLPDTVKVIPSPNVLVNPAGPQTICAGAPVTLCIPTGVNQTYQWYLNNVAIAGANANCYVAGAAGSYRVAATNVVTGCADTSIPTVLTVNAIPVVTISANGPTTVCNGTNVVLTANSGTAVAWQWQLNGSNITGATASSYTVTATGNYTVVVNNTVGCSATSAPTVVTVNTTPGTVTPQSSTSFCTGGSVVLQAPVGTGFTYQWYVGATAIAGATSSSYTATTTGNFYVIVTNPATGCSTTSTPVAVTAGAGPNSTITPQGTVAGCQKGSVKLQAVAQPGLCYQWNLNGTPITGANSDSYVATAAGSYTVTVTICAQTTCNSTTTTPTVVNLNPLPNATVTPASVNSFCQGDSAVLSANAGAGLTYQWYQNGAPISGATNPTYAVKSNGNYQVMVTNTTTGCSDTNTSIAVSVKPAPNSTITAAGNPTFCQGGSVVLNAATSGITGYQWYLNGNAITTGGTTASYTAAATGLYTVKVTGTNGCAATSASTSVQVNALPNVVTVPTGAAAVCQGYTTLLSVPSGPGLAYQWYNGTTAISGATSNTYTTGTAGTYNVTVTNTVTSCFATSSNIVLSVNTPPVATASTVGSTTICQGDSVKISANTGTGFFYQWKLNGVDVIGATGSVFYAQAAGRYTVAVSNATNCTTLSNSIQIQVNPRPAAYITYNTPLEFCEGSAVVLTANSGTGLTYQWYMDGVALPNTTAVNVSAKSGAYTLKVTNSFLCVNTADTLDVTVWPAPVPSIVRAGTTLSTSQPYASYQWFFNNNAVGGATSATYSYTQNGAYKVRVIDDNGCEGYSNQFFVNNVGITQTTAGKSIKVYPNPSNSIVHIDASVKIKVVLRDVTGRSVLEAKEVTEIDMSDIATGPYLLYITDMEGQLLRIEKLTKSDR
jgi:hypothetical protein